MDPLVATMAIVMVTTIPMLLAVDPNNFPSLREGREPLVVAVVIVLATATVITVSIIVSHNPSRRSHVLWSAAMDSFVMAIAVWITIIEFLYDPPSMILVHDVPIYATLLRAFEIAVCITFAAAIHIVIYTTIVIVMHVAVYIWLFLVYTMMHVLVFCTYTVVCGIYVAKGMIAAIHITTAAA